MGRNMIINAVLLALFATLGTALVAFTWDATAERIAENERQSLLEKIHALIPASRYDNDLYRDRISVTAPAYLGTDQPVQVFRAREDHDPVALVLSPVAPDGYNGDIHLLVAVNYDGSLAGVRVLSHKETPGLGDRIEEKRSNWIDKFAGRSLKNPAPARWKVKRDNGAFDQFTGATITPRAVVKAVYNTLRYCQGNREALFAPAPGDEHEEHRDSHHKKEGHDEH